MKTVRSLAVPFVLAAGLTLAGCGQVSEQIADLLKPPSSGEMSERIKTMAAQGKVQEAIQKGESFAAKKPPEVQKVHLVLAQIYLDSGDAVGALKHMQLANGEPDMPAAGGPAQPQSPPGVAKPAAAAPAGVSANAGGGVSATVSGSGGVEARAGGVTAKVPD